MYSNAYIRNLEQWYWRIYLQGNNGGTDIEKTYGHGEREGEGEMFGKCNMETYTTICKIDSNRNLLYISETQIGALYKPEAWNGKVDGREAQKGGDICIPMADSCWGLTENSKIL